MSGINKNRAFDVILQYAQIFLQKLILSRNLFFKNELINHAGAAAFFFLLSIPPVFLLILISFDHYLASYPDISAHFFSFLKTLNLSMDKDTLKSIGLLNVNTTAMGIFGLLNLLWAGRWVLSGIQRGLEIIFPAEKARPTLVLNIFSFVILSILLLVSVLITFISISFQFYLNLVDDNRIVQSFFQSLLPVIRHAVTFGVVFSGIFLVYRFVPQRKPKTVPSMTGALLCTVMILFLHAVFSEFFSVARYNVIYGVLGSLILTALWVHFSFILFFFFAQYTYVSDKIDVLVLERVYALRLSPDAKGSKLEKFLFRHPKKIFEKYARFYDQGAILFREADRSSDIYIIYQGTIGIYRQVDGIEKKIASLDKGEIFGEMAYLLDESRTATAKTEADSILLVITPETFDELLMANRIVSRDVIESLSDRLRKTQLSATP